MTSFRLSMLCWGVSGAGLASWAEAADAMTLKQPRTTAIIRSGKGEGGCITGSFRGKHTEGAAKSIRLDCLCCCFSGDLPLLSSVGRTAGGNLRAVSAAPPALHKGDRTGWLLR